MNVASRIIKNSSLLIIASLINNLMTFILTLFTARYLGTYNFGLISSATSLVGIFEIFTDMGLATFAIREVSRDKTLTSRYFGTVFFLRVIFSVVTFIAYTLVVLLSHTFTPEGIDVMIIFGVYMIFNSLTLCNYSLFQSNEKMQYQTIGNVIYSASVLAIILLIIFNGGNVIIVSLAYPIAIILSFSYTVYIAIKHYPKLSLCLERAFLKKLITKGVPFGISYVFTSIYFWIALTILTFMSGSVAVGLFSASQKLLLVIAAMITLISNSIFPVMSELFTKDKLKLADLYHKLMKYMLIISMPIVLGCVIFSHDIIYIIYGASYTQGSNALSILIWAGIFLFLSNISTTLLGAINRQFTVTKIVAIGAFVSIILNVILIKFYSYIGASISTVCIEALILSLTLYALSKTDYSLHMKSMIKPVTQVIIANLIMVIAIYVLHLPFIVTVPIAALVYIIALFITGSIDQEDRKILYGFIEDMKKEKIHKTR
ncbi:flippase [Methanosphaera cuniculi]|uniref:flippase n=1 Tax=Methanosphaera cuniculi TaxID=1077256 RepID=UPI0026EF7950|nr:flippase [Methanosphaera cuniculi]